MELSAELWESTVGSITGDQAQGLAERRVNPRVGLRCRTNIAIYENGVLQPPVNVWTRDISKDGIGVMSARYLSPGTRFVVRLPRKHHKDPLLLLCTTRNCDELADGIYAVGATFGRAISAPQKPAAPAAGAAPGHSEDDEVNRIRKAIVS
ncbi:MAG TPA: hypothetical protein VFC78_02135 [Tepidisphaeraceae bacterium]|nr:hypothetical protein [Tepidisphaeraceae bacterium]